MKKIFTIFLSVALLCVMAVPTFAAESDYPTFVPDNQFFIYENFSDVKCYSFNGSRYDVYFTRGSFGSGVNNYIVFDILDNQNYPTITEYVISDGDWVFSREINTSGSDDYYLNFYDYTPSIVDANIDIRNRLDGGYLFQLTPPPTMMEVVTEELQNFQVTTVGVMKTLTLCGVGLIASFLALKVFGRVFPIFRV